MDLEKRKKIFSILAALSIGTATVSHEKIKKEVKKQKYFVIEVDSKNAYVYETDDIYDNKTDYHFFTSDGNNYIVDAKNSIVTQNLEEVENYCNKLKENGISISFVLKEKKLKKTRRL